MRIGIITDIHDEVDHLDAALAKLRSEGVDLVVSMGDTTDFHGTDNRAWEVAKILRDAGAIGIWGNHDYGLCRDVPLDIIDNPDFDALACFAEFRPRLSKADCHFTHVEPWVDAEDAIALWYFDGLPDTAEKLDRSFRAVPESQMFMGHFHRWFAGTSRGVLPWCGGDVLKFEPVERYLVIVAALFDGWFALFDTDTRTLYPHRTP